MSVLINSVGANIRFWRNDTRTSFEFEVVSRSAFRVYLPRVLHVCNYYISISLDSGNQPKEKREGGKGEGWRCSGKRGGKEEEGLCCSKGKDKQTDKKSGLSKKKTILSRGKKKGKTDRQKIKVVMGDTFYCCTACIPNIIFITSTFYSCVT